MKAVEEFQRRLDSFVNKTRANKLVMAAVALTNITPLHIPHITSCNDA